MPVFSVYVIYSQTVTRFYIGQSSLSPLERLEQHNAGKFENKFTAKGIPWELFVTITCNSREQAMKIEKHIKAMKSKKYVEDLRNYPEIIQKLLVKYRD